MGQPRPGVRRGKPLTEVAEARVSRTHRCPYGRPPVLKTGGTTGSQALPCEKMHILCSMRIYLMQDGLGEIMLDRYSDRSMQERQNCA